MSASPSSLPKYAERPSPPAKIVSASPDTIWLARRVTVRNAWIAAIAAPAAPRRDNRREQDDGTRAVEPLRRPEADRGAEQHHPLDPEVEHAGALREQLAQSGVEERRAIEHGLREHEHEQAVVDSHAAGSVAGPAGRCSRAKRTR